MNRKQDTNETSADGPGISGGTNSLEILGWDSSFFGYKVGKTTAKGISPATVNKIIEQARNKEVRLLYLFTDGDDKISQDSTGAVAGKLVDKKLTFNLKIGDADFDTDDHIEPFIANYPSEKLILLAIQSGLYSRYKSDTNFKNNEFEKLYTAWIVNSVKKKIADYVFVYKEDGVELGFVTLKLNDTYGQIGLIAVDESVRGRSIGKKLIFTVASLLKKRGIGSLQVPTQKDNTGACQFYRSIGFEEIKTENIYHIWL
jgi:dTDP-4-amino-4,6-dideoxy-D-galactose acyltransferase